MSQLDKTFRCDFCGAEVAQVARVAIAPGYDRMYAQAKYACKNCHQQKEKERVTIEDKTNDSEKQID